ncbi:PRC-barrel domain-containing protein [Pseudooceanicola sp.]|uniref:PRC-barrel domain-containing protein n=1 Tax=Pseudooceanicola sp. TaxID=1914328 RepID=UPI0035C774EB
MKPILTGIAALMISATPVLAQSQTTGDGASDDVMDSQATTGNQGASDSSIGTYESDRAASMNYADAIRTRDITGGEIYSTGGVGGDWNADTRYDLVDRNWAEIGEIEDIILDRDGQMTGVVAEVGGFLDIADKHVILNVDRMRLVPVDDRSYSVVTNMTEEELENLPSVDEGFWN